MANVVMNEKRKAIIEVLQNSKEPLTLEEISEKVGFKVMSGTTNAMESAGIIKIAGKKEVKKITHKKVNIYEFGQMPSEK